MSHLIVNNTIELFTKGVYINVIYELLRKIEISLHFGKMNVKEFFRID